jgi:hypothetical protein
MIMAANATHAVRRNVDTRACGPHCGRDARAPLRVINGERGRLARFVRLFFCRLEYEHMVCVRDD